MPISKTVEKFVCEFCEKEYKTVDEASTCEHSHDIVYVPIQRQDLKRLNSFLSSGNPDYLTESLVKTIRKYNKLLGVIR